MTITPSLTGVYRKPSIELSMSMLQVFGAVLFLALCSQICIPLFFTPVYLTGQTFAVMLIGATMGSKRGVLSILTYIASGCFNLPVFAGASFGFAPLVGPMGGYLLGFILQAFFVGWCLERQAAANSARVFGILICSCVLQMGVGALWLSKFVGIESALIYGIVPFIGGEIFKSLCLTAYLKQRCLKASSLT